MFKTIDTESLPRARMSGIKPALLKNLGSLVILSGPNGAGKTRFFSLLEEARRASAMDDLALHQQIMQITAQREAMEGSCRVDSKPLAQPLYDDLIAHEEAYKHQLTSPIVLADRTDSNFTVLVLPPMTGGLGGSPVDTQLSQVRMWENEIEFQPTHGLGRVNAHLVGVALSLYQANHPDHKNDPRVAAGLRRATAFIGLIRDLIGVEVYYNVEPGFPFPTIDGRRYSPGELSNGQSVLLAWATVIETRVWRELQDRTVVRPRLVLAIDEPENHLHPKAAVDVLRRIIDYVGPKGQVWISTHSPTILAAFASRSSVYHVVRGQIEYASANLTKVIEGLVGGEAERHMLRDMLDDADRVAFYKFAAECLEAAMVMGDASESDPQSRQLTAVIRTRLGAGRKIRVLDYASGKARFAMALAELLIEADRSNVDYLTYDDPNFDASPDEKLRNLARLYPLESGTEVAKRASRELSEFTHEGRVDVVVLCNALHEIPSSEWFALFCNIQSVISEAGVLLVLEDLEMPVGELPNRHGYLVLTLADLRDLFGTSVEVQPVSSEVRRCSAVTVSCAALQPFAEGEAYRNRFEVQLGKALESVRRRALAEIKALRDTGEVGHANGRRHARAAMLLANVEIARNR